MTIADFILLHLADESMSEKNDRKQKTFTGSVKADETRDGKNWLLPRVLPELGCEPRTARSASLFFFFLFFLFFFSSFLFSATRAGRPVRGTASDAGGPRRPREAEKRGEEGGGNLNEAKRSLVFAVSMPANFDSDTMSQRQELTFSVCRRRQGQLGQARRARRPSRSRFQGPQLCGQGRVVDMFRIHFLYTR